jgi:hypothetical protein
LDEYSLGLCFGGFPVLYKTVSADFVLVLEVLFGVVLGGRFIPIPFLAGYASLVCFVALFGAVVC